MLVLLATDPERDTSRCEQALLLALNSHRTEILEEVRVMLFGDGVRILDPSIDADAVFNDLITRLHKEGVEVVACTGNLVRHNLAEAARRAAVAPAGAQVYVSARLTEDFAVVTF